MGKKRLTKAEELDLVPIMNMVTILIPFLHMGAEFITLAVIDSTLPAIGPPAEAKEVDPDEEKPLNLSIIVTRDGYTVAGNGADAVLKPEGSAEPEALPEGEAPPPTIPCKEAGCPTPESYDVGELTRLLGLLKDEFPNDENVILVPESRILYDVLVQTMDATREDPKTKVDGKPRLLFPYVIIAGGAE